jgi:lactate dehydrogenase-like 2-hydroxyacid dehydrogenase
MTRPLVLVTRRLPADWITPLADACELVIGDDTPGWTPELLERLPQADAIFALLTERIDDAVLAAAPKLRVVSNMAVGVDNIDVEACTRRRIPVGHTPGVLTEATADLAFALVLAASRGLVTAAADARSGRWTTWSPTGWLGRDLYGATIGILGFGKIGRAVARRAAGFGMRVLVHSRSAIEHPQVEAVTWAQLLAESDIVSVHVPLDAHTRAMVDASALAQMKRDALLVNTARGPIVDTDALVEALRTDRLGGAALDVTDPEPLPPSHPLFACPSALVLPHIGSATHGTRRAMARLAADNLLAGLSGATLPHCVNPAVYDPPA